MTAAPNGRQGAGRYNRTMAQRYFVDALPRPGPFHLDGELSHHLGKVLRARPGDEVRLADGRGRSAAAGVVSVDRDRVTLEVGPAVFCASPTRRVHLAFAPPRRNRGEWLFEHGTEVGVAVFWPVWTTRTRPQGERAERWQRIIRAAAGQCDRDWLPEIRPAMEMAEFLASVDLPQQRLVADRDGAPVPTLSDSDVALLVGPEGGFSDEERAATAAAGFKTCSFGPHVLRTETAALVGAATLMV